MRTRTFTLLVLLACDEPVINRPREDAGGPGDSGIDGPLALAPGMVFTYDAILTHRGQAQGMERNSRYTLVVTIGSVDDQGGRGDSTLSFTATGMQTLNDDWDGPTDFDLWVARLGPALVTDAVSADPVTEALTSPPRIPPVPTPPKRLPRDGTFFLDVRAIDRIRAAFSDAHQGQQPQTVDPGMSGVDRWVFSFAGPDGSIFYYPDPSKTRSIRLEYEPRGFLTRLDETIGDASNPPSANARLTLMSGPP
jgi:hypothetical protein